MAMIGDQLKALRVSAALLLAGQLSYIVITLFHTGGPANDHPTIFARYAASDSWTAVHVGQFACMALVLGGLFILSFALDVEDGAGKWASRLGAALAVAAVALYGAVLAVDGVALKQAVNAWAAAPEPDKIARLASAEAMRWLEWGMRSYENFMLGLAVLLFSVAIFQTRLLPGAIAYPMALSGLAYLMQGWLAGAEGFSHSHEIGIISAEVFNIVWMSWLMVVAWRERGSLDGPIRKPDLLNHS